METTTAYSHIYASGKLLQEKVTTSGTTETHNFFYDNTGKPYAMQVNGTTYYYVTNLQGDVMGLVDTSGTSVASYTYDPYGKVLTATGALAEKNPLRYRGYYYDSESSLYYLQSRYYDPATRRFVNADSYSSTGQGLIGHNMFAYCGNDPINKEDRNGKFWNILVGAVVGAAASAVTQIASNLINGNNWSDGIVSAVVVGSVGGAIAATGLGIGMQAALTGIAASAGDALQQGVDNGFDKIDGWKAIRTGLVAGATSLIGSYAGKRFLGGIEDLGNSYISQGHQKNLTGVIRALDGESHTSYYRAGVKLIEKGTQLVNFYRGAGSCLGSFIGISTGMANNLAP